MAQDRAVRNGSDLYKSAHRMYAALLQEDVRTAGVRVRPDTHRWQTGIEAYARSARLDVVVERTLADPAEIRAVSAAYRPAGYRIELVSLAVAEADSQLAILQRFFDCSFRYVSWHNCDAGATLSVPHGTVMSVRQAER